MANINDDNISAEQFEASVRQVASQLFRFGKAHGAVKLLGRERDEVIDTGTEIVIVEATQSRKLDKTKYDLKKSIELVREFRKSASFSDYNYRIILVTSNDPTADQNEYVKTTSAGCPKEILSFSNFFAKLFDARHYIRIRGSHYFGSVRDPANEKNFDVPQSDYIPTALSDSQTGQSFKAFDVANNLQQGGQFVFYGDYGSGKSMTLRDIYFKVRDSFIAGEHFRCPIYLNLREHIAQRKPDEALYRHADEIGFANSHSLIAAWRAGFVTLFLDGFDELTPPQFASSVTNLRQARRFAVELVAKFIEQTPKEAPVILAGRENYFDTRKEAQLALGYTESANVYDLAGFTDKDIKRFLKTKGDHIPSWLPTRPLLLGYLANAGVLKSDDYLLALDPANGWNQILDGVCDREVKQVWGVGFEASDLRRYLEGLATLSRKTPTVLGLEQTGLKSVFRSVFGRDADEPASLLTARLPGLAAKPGKPGAREFIDDDFRDAAASGDFRRYIEAPFGDGTPLVDISVGLGDLGRQMAILDTSDVAKKTSIAMRQSSLLPQLSVNTGDLLFTLMDLGLGYDGDYINIEDGHFENIIIDTELDFSKIKFVRCTINSLDLGHFTNFNLKSRILSFVDCVIGRVEGAVSLSDVPSGLFQGSTSVESFSAYAETNDAVMQTNLPDQLKVLLTILRKLFMQRGNGRQYSAFARGLPVSLKKYVIPITDQVKAQGFAQDIYLDRRTILIPNRSRRADAFSIINGPNTSTHALVMKVREI